MSIILTYHNLVERDLEFVARRWQVVIIVLLFGIAICNLITSFKLHSLDVNFEERCFIESTIHFKPKPYEPVAYDLDYTMFRSIKKEMAWEMEFDEKDKFFLDRQEIDAYNTFWGDNSYCVFASVTPLFFTFCAMIWITMFLISGHGGHDSSVVYVADKPWKIVVPSLIFFIAAAAATFVLLMFVKFEIDKFCDELNRNLVGDYYCGFLLEKFSLIKPGDNRFSRDCYGIILQSLGIANVLWIVAAVIMILRVVFVIDFQLIRITISTLEPTTLTNEYHILNNNKDADDNERNDDTKGSVDQNDDNQSDNDLLMLNTDRIHVAFKRKTF